MTNHWIDIKNADCILIIGSNAAENHPISFKWVLAAKERDPNVKIFHIDPRFSRTSSKADTYIRIRSGTDIAFIGGMIYHILNDMRVNPTKYNLEYVQNYTNAAYVINSGIKLPGDSGQNGLFSGWNTSDKAYGTGTWEYELATTYPDPTDPIGWKRKGIPNYQQQLLSPNWEDWVNRTATEDAAWAELDDRCVLKLLWRNYKRYTKDTVSRITGIPVQKLDEVYSEYARTGAKEKAGTIMYAMGATQHTYGTQNIRGYAILQLLLGNIGIAGGGINALRGTSNVQGSTDFALLYQYLPGYLGVPDDRLGDQTLGEAARTKEGGFSGFLGRITPKDTAPPQAESLTGTDPVNWRQHFPKYVVSLLKTWWPNIDPAVSYAYLPKGKKGANYSHLPLIEAIGREEIEGLWVWGQNPAAGGPDSKGARAALGKLKWMMASDIWFNETHTFWQPKDPNDPESECKGIPGVKTKDIQTEIFLLPAAASFEKEGSITNSGRWAQWRYKAVEPPEMAMSDLDMMSRLFKRIQELYADPTDTATHLSEPITQMDWPYGDEASPDFVAREINGYALVGGTIPRSSGGFYDQGELIEWFGDLQPDSRTSSGNWLFCGQYNKATAADQANYAELITVVNGFPSINKARKRNNVDNSIDQKTGLYANWSWCWPRNRRIIYNRASVDLNGNPWDPDHPVLKWDSTANSGKGAWQTGSDIEDGGGKPINVATGTGTDAKRLPFIMNSEGVGKLWGYGLKDGPIPEVYEPWESPLATNPLSGVPKGELGFNDPAAYIGKLEFDGTDWNQRGTVEEFPYVATTYRCTEHWQTGIMTRNLPWLAELMPEMYVELGEDLAGKLEIASGDKVKVSSKRGEIEALAIVTKRFQAITVGDGQVIHHVGIPWHWGYAGRVTGDSGNILTPHVGDANTSIPEYKTFLCKVEKA